ncbi:MAG: hypothetical protein DMG96_40930 [Acidobacteria bacterium]|nr:MAG: hypothetical protein DMG96_40930 [Acidobacteriota bacterium]
MQPIALYPLPEFAVSEFLQPPAPSLLVHTLVPRSLPERGLRKELLAFLVQAFCTLIGVGWNHGCWVSPQRSAIW